MSQKMIKKRSPSQLKADNNYEGKREPMCSAKSTIKAEQDAFPDACKSVNLSQREVLLLVSRNIKNIVELFLK